MREHVHFIDDEDLVPVSGRVIAGLLFQFPDFIDAAIGSRVNFKNIHAVARGDLEYRRGSSLQGSPGLPSWQFNAFARIRAVVVLPLPRGPEKRNAWATRPLCKGIQQSPGNMLLSYQFMEILGTPFAGKNLILHREKGRAPGILLHI